ncbi:uncharacterized protein YALI1_C18383g [Yarrowia lipolytica]|uniref:Uncharacterized protein n=1 Tax=Yarrowia lipolytica TaxID=4952 RepID=A0A1D8NAY6_YARLL|nr:hypothetical protein YALI1_C18383g [Yarrowia lipolytica]
MSTHTCPNSQKSIPQTLLPSNPNSYRIWYSYSPSPVQLRRHSTTEGGSVTLHLLQSIPPRTSFPPPTH